MIKKLNSTEIHKIGILGNKINEIIDVLDSHLEPVNVSVEQVADYMYDYGEEQEETSFVKQIFDENIKMIAGLRHGNIESLESKIKELEKYKKAWEHLDMYAIYTVGYGFEPYPHLKEIKRDIERKYDIND